MVSKRLKQIKLANVAAKWIIRSNKPLVFYASCDGRSQVCNSFLDFFWVRNAVFF